MDDNVPKLKRQDNICVVKTPPLETVSDVERDEEFDMFLEKLIRAQEVRNARRETGKEYVEPPK